jgi:DNA helicase-2/ATP-dependent DNA helicase PcrA
MHSQCHQVGKPTDSEPSAFIEEIDHHPETSINRSRTSHRYNSMIDKDISGCDQTQNHISKPANGGAPTNTKRRITGA